MVELTSGDLLDARVEALVNAVNTVGVMGAGLAAQFKVRYPEMFREYVTVCQQNRLRPGMVHVWLTGVDEPRYVINVPTKRHWRKPSRFADVAESVEALRVQVGLRRIRSVAVPALGCGLGGLEWPVVRELVEATFKDEPVRVYLYAPGFKS